MSTKMSTSIKATAEVVGCSEMTVKAIRDFERKTGLHITTNHTGKMLGTMSLSTLCKVNPLCVKRMQNGESVCSKCFSDRQWNMYGEKASRKFATNYTILNEYRDTFPVLDLGDAPFFRGESFGDLGSWKAAAYFLRLAKANKGTRIALWTKNPWFIRQALKKLGWKRKPGNLQVVLSSLRLNEPQRELAKMYTDVVDKLFTVYTKDYLAEHPEVKINCGALNCHYQCGYKCYKRWHEKGIREINEVLK